MEVTRYDEAPSYEAPGHFDVYGLRLQGFEVSKTRNFWMSISHFLPSGRVRVRRHSAREGVLRARGRGHRQDG